MKWFFIVKPSIKFKIMFDNSTSLPIYLLNSILLLITKMMLISLCEREMLLVETW